jgi:hypothetical protein
MCSTICYNRTKLEEKLQRFANDGYHGENLFKA